MGGRAIVRWFAYFGIAGCTAVSGVGDFAICDQPDSCVAAGPDASAGIDGATGSSGNNVSSGGMDAQTSSDVVTASDGNVPRPDASSPPPADASIDTRPPDNTPIAIYSDSFGPTAGAGCGEWRSSDGALTTKPKNGEDFLCEVCSTSIYGVTVERVIANPTLGTYDYAFSVSKGNTDTSWNAKLEWSRLTGGQKSSEQASGTLTDAWSPGTLSIAVTEPAKDLRTKVTGATLQPGQCMLIDDLRLSRRR